MSGAAGRSASCWTRGCPMAAEVQVRVFLDWSGPEHRADGPALPCEVCTGPTVSTTRDGRRCHRWCFEDVLARELVGRAHARIADERLPLAERTEVAA